ncbi:MAG: hypothetical protein KatS3mg028_1133 [Bacteroidia bacterium]|nr:MAG: hypothetical protein KatS3mg028_1133 [Bacteroidia bacterium]
MMFPTAPASIKEIPKTYHTLSSFFINCLTNHTPNPQANKRNTVNNNFPYSPPPLYAECHAADFPVKYKYAPIGKFFHNAQRDSLV